MDKKLLIFDLDGTLSDTQPLLHTMVYRTLLDSGIEIESVEAVTKSMIINDKKVFEDNRALIPCEFIPMVDQDQYGIDFWKNYDALFMDSVNRVFDGIYETLCELKKRGYLLAVLSNKKDRFVQPIIATAFSEEFFDFVCGWDEIRPKKPDPTSLLDILAELGVEKENAWMIGDLSADYKVSVNAGVNHVIADWGYGEKKKLIKLGATVFAEKPLDLLAILN